MYVSGDSASYVDSHAVLGTGEHPVSELMAFWIPLDIVSTIEAT